MPNADSIIRVSIIGDAKKLVGATKDADKATGGLLKAAGLALGGLALVDKGFDFVQDSLGEADRLGDAMSRLQISIGKTDTQKLSDIAEDFHNLGLSKQDVLELAANFADVATAVGINPGAIGDFADDVAATAAAIALLDPEGRDPAQFVDAIGKAAGGSEKAFKLLGINVDEAAVAQQALQDTGKDNPKMLTDSELAAARLKIIMEKLKPKLDDATKGTADLEQSQADLQAQIETLSGKVGTVLEPVLNDLLGSTLKEIDAIGDLADSFGPLQRGIQDFARFVATPLANVADLARDVAAALGSIHVPTTPFQVSPGRAPRNSSISDSSVTRSIQRTSERTGGLGRSQGGP